MVIDEILNYATKKEVIIFFDMDGVMVEYGAGEKDKILNNEPGFYFNKRPIHTIINVIKELSKIENVTLGIISNCYYKEQEKDKLLWLDKYVPYLNKEYIKIVKLKEETYTKETKDYIKAKYLKEMVNNKDAIVYFFEDDHGIIKSTKKVLPEVNVHHISTLIY